MNPDDLTTTLRAKAQHVANHLNALTPYERSLVLHEAQAIWDEREATRVGEVTSAENDELHIAATAAWIVQKLHTMTPQSRQELLHLVEGMSNNARLERLMGDGQADF